MSVLTTTEPSRNESPTAKAVSLAYVMLERPDLERAARFLADFGLKVVQHTADSLALRGTASLGPCYLVTRARTPRFRGFGLAVGSRLELQHLAALPHASAMETLPDGGERVRLLDPAGFVVDALFGLATGTVLPQRAPLAINTAAQQPRVNATQRPPIAPPEVVNLGHLVLHVPALTASCAWYTRHFGFLPSDVQVLPDGSPAVVFLRVNRGDVPCDHHTLALAQSITAELGHVAFEVVDVDAVGVGERILRERGWSHAWGIGRHMLGSQIFDYWHDPWGDKHEHYTDGDLLSESAEMGVHAASRQAMAQWGPAMPRSFTKPRLTPATIASLVRNLRTSPDLTLSKLITLAKTFG